MTNRRDSKSGMGKRSRGQRKAKLKKQTLRDLESPDRGSIVGGARYPSKSNAIDC